MTIFSVKHSTLLRQPEYLLSRERLKALIEKVTDNLVNITDERGEFLLRLDDGRVIDTKAGPSAGNGPTASVCTAFISITSKWETTVCAPLSMIGSPKNWRRARR